MTLDVCGFENDSVRDSSLIAKAPNCENVFSLKITESNLGCQVNVKIKVRSIIRSTKFSKIIFGFF